MNDKIQQKKNGNGKSRTFPDLLAPTRMGEGYHKLDRKVVGERAPQIAWGPMFLGLEYDPDKGRYWSDQDRLDYALKLAASMNHAAYLMQEERNRLGELLEEKERLLLAANNNRERSNLTSQEQMAKDNTEKQDLYQSVDRLTKENMALKVRLKELSDGYVS